MIPREAALLQGKAFFRFSVFAVQRVDLGLYTYALLCAAQGTDGREFKRNIFLANFILEATNELRTPKQVSSRLQQLRGTTKDDRRMYPHQSVRIMVEYFIS